MVNKIKAKRLKLDIFGLNMDLAHKKLLEFLRKKNLLNPRYLFRGSDIQEILVSRNVPLNVSRNIEASFEGLGYDDAPKNSIDCFTAEQMRAIDRGELDKLSPIEYTSETGEYAIIVYKAKYLKYLGERTDFEYEFRNPDNKFNAVQNFIVLRP
jgi:hypothetical protein